MTDTMQAVMHRLSKLSTQNAETIRAFDAFLEENRLSQGYKKNTMKSLILFCRYIADKPLHKVSKNDVKAFLRSKERSSEVDMEQRWVTTYNDYLSRLKMFFRWLYNKDTNLPREEWTTPECVQMKKIKRKVLSAYSPSDIWNPDEVLLAVKYCSNNRDKALITAMYDLAGRNHEVIKLRIKDIVFKDNYAEAMVSWDTKTGQRPVPLILSFATSGTG